MIVNFDGVPLVTGNGAADEIITAEVRPKLAEEARRLVGVENNISQFGHRGFVAVKGGAHDCWLTANTGCRGRTRSNSPTARAAASRLRAAPIARGLERAARQTLAASATKRVKAEAPSLKRQRLKRQGLASRFDR
jgi:hypothetical protein